MPGIETLSFISKVRIMTLGGVCRDTVNCSEGYKGAWPGRQERSPKSLVKMKSWTPTAGYPLYSWIRRNKSEFRRQSPSSAPPALNTSLNWGGFRFRRSRVYTSWDPPLRKRIQKQFTFANFKTTYDHANKLWVPLSCVPEYKLHWFHDKSISGTQQTAVGAKT